jgi:hypothetical protein
LGLTFVLTGIAQCDSTELARAGNLLNRDTFLNLRTEAFKKMDSCFWNMVESDKVIPQNIPELFVIHAHDSSLSLYSYRFRIHSGLFSYRAILLKKDKVYRLTKDNVVGGDLQKSKRYSMDDWYGAIYYNLVNKKIGGMEYYFLFGYRDLDETENQKLIDVLWFDEKDNLQLGAAYFDIPEFEEAQRYYFDYGEIGAAKLNYDPHQQLILKDHLIVSIVNGKPVMLPDGSYEAMEWMKKKWRYIEKVYD